MADMVPPPEIIKKMAAAGEMKANLPADQCIVRGMAAGGLLGAATTISIKAWSDPALPNIVGALIFPLGFCTLVLTGNELATGNMALIPVAMRQGKTDMGKYMHNLAFVLLGNLIGCMCYAIMYYLIFSELGEKTGLPTEQELQDGIVVAPHPIANKIRAIAYGKTVKFEDMGGKGFFFAYIKAIMCNWLVCYGVTMSMVSTTAIGRIAAMWLPIFTFFYLGYEHLIVNFFVIPTGIMFGADTDIGKMILWNWIPVFFGNMTGGLILGMHHQYMHAPAAAPAGK